MRNLSAKWQAALHEAARMLWNDGTEAIDSASRLVGEEAALAMLVMHLTHAYNRNRTVWPMKEGTKEWIANVVDHL